MNNPVTKDDKSLLARLEQHNINGDLDRWSAGIEHHPMSEKIVKDLQGIDFMFFGMYFDWKIGGDGDIGETLMYQLDVLFELYDKEKSLIHL